ncbi:MAG TPA: ATP-binding protein [Candidatus Acidoferrales bacterium]|nr:ATP-binding protein [Candidatus Acidoferrales bacterium]
MKCKRCQGKAEVQIRHHNSAFCRSCFVFYFQRQVQRAIEKEHMCTPEEETLVAVSGGKDSLALWDALVALGYRTAGVHLALGIGRYSHTSTAKTEAFAQQRGLRLITVRLEEDGAAIPALAAFTNRPACAACGTAKRHYFDRVAFEHGFTVLATGHNLDDEAARLMGNVMHWQVDHLAKQQPVLQPTHERFARKVKPLYRLSEYETAVYAFFRGIDYMIDECPNSLGATQLRYKEVLNRLEAAMPATKLSFVQEFLRVGRPAFAARADAPPQSCERCGMPAFGALCSFCSLLREVEVKQSRRQAARAAGGA